MRVDLGFLAPPGDLADWRMVLVADLADKSGLLDALPGTAEAVAERAGVHTKSTRVLLDALTVFDLVAVETAAADGDEDRVPSTIVCDECGEGAMAGHVTRHDGRDLCRPCLEKTASAPTDHAPPGKAPFGAVACGQTAA